MTSQFDNIYHGMSPEIGKLRIAPSGIAWKGVDTETVIPIASEDIKWAQWLRVARNFQFRVGLKEHKKVKFDGFLRDDHDKLANILKNHFGITLESREISLKGWNWGVTDFQGEDLVFMISDRTAFELPLQHLTNSNIAGKTEVSLEFSNPSPASSAGPRTKLTKPMGDELTEIRFFVPGTMAKLKGSDAGSHKSDNEDEEEEEISAAQVFHDSIKDKANIGLTPGDLILSFEEVLVVTPRGRYELEMFPNFLRLRGKTYDYKILYQSIARLFLLPKDDMHVLFILGLSTPIRQGQTSYQFLVMQFTREEEITAELNLSEEELKNYEKLKKNYEAPTFEVVSTVFRALSGKKIISSGSFLSRDGHPGLKANLKATQGELFMLERYIFFVSKQPLLVELSDIYQVVFSRVGAGGGTTSGRTFDIKIVTKSGPEHSFTSVNKEELDSTQTYLKEKGIRIKTEVVPDVDRMMAEVGVDDDDDDDMQSISDDSDVPNNGVKKPRGGDDESSEEDEDFKASDSDSGSPSDSESDASGAKTASDASGDRVLAQEAKKKPKKAAKGKGKDESASTVDAGAKKAPKKKKPSASASNAGFSSDEDEKKEKSKPKATAPKPKPKPKPAAKNDDAMDVDSEDDKEKPKPKPKKPKPKTDDAAPKASSSKPKPKKEDSMDVDEDERKEKPRPKPKLATKKKEEKDSEPPKKKAKKED